MLEPRHGSYLEAIKLYPFQGHKMPCHWPVASLHDTEFTPPLPWKSSVSGFLGSSGPRRRGPIGFWAAGPRAQWDSKYLFSSSWRSSHRSLTDTFLNKSCLVKRRKLLLRTFTNTWPPLSRMCGMDPSRLTSLLYSKCVFPTCLTSPINVVFLWQRLGKNPEDYPDAKN